MSNDDQDALLKKLTDATVRALAETFELGGVKNVSGKSVPDATITEKDGAVLSNMTTFISQYGNDKEIVSRMGTLEKDGKALPFFQAAFGDTLVRFTYDPADKSVELIGTRGIPEERKAKLEEFLGQYIQEALPDDTPAEDPKTSPQESSESSFKVSSREKPPATKQAFAALKRPGMSV
jgi:hypothetical protein